MYLALNAADMELFIAKKLSIFAIPAGKGEYHLKNRSKKSPVIFIVGKMVRLNRKMISLAFSIDLTVKWF